jgi:hypothetical protein
VVGSQGGREVGLVANMSCYSFGSQPEESELELVPGPWGEMGGGTRGKKKQCRIPYTTLHSTPMIRDNVHCASASVDIIETDLPGPLYIARNGGVDGVRASRGQ